MTEAGAIDVLIRFAAKGVAGAGQGLREEITYENQALVAKAIDRLHEKAHGYPPSRSTFLNMGLPWPTSDTWEGFPVSPTRERINEGG